jgi:hypothetical protein
MQYKTKKNWEIYEVKDITDYIKMILRDTKYGSLYYKISDISQAEEVKVYLNNPQNTSRKSIRDMRTGLPDWYEQEVEYKRSNLGRGFLWYFICNHCGHRAKLLYLYNYTKSPLCRECLGIDYKRRSRKRDRLGRPLPAVENVGQPVIDSRRKKTGMASIVYIDR